MNWSNLDTATIKEMYRKLYLIRIFEQRVSDLVANRMIWGTAHLCIGQEAVAVGVCTALRKDDYITSTHRGHGHCIAKGADIKRMMAELMGKTEGYCKGKGGSMHICDFDGGNLGANAIVGGGIPIATGAALGGKMQGMDRISVSFFGEAAANLGIFHESINMATIWKLPVIYVCENNQYSISVPVSEVMAVANVVERAPGYGIPAHLVNGNDMLAVYSVTTGAAERVRSGGGPELIECNTYRQKPHSAGIPWETRSKDEIQSWVARDPLTRHREAILCDKILSEEEITILEHEAKKELESAVHYAEKCQDPSLDALTEDVYV